MSDCLASSLHTDRSGKWKAKGVNRPQHQGTESLESILSGDKSTQWLVLHRSNDVFEVTRPASRPSGHEVKLPSFLADTLPDLFRSGLLFPRSIRLPICYRELSGSKGLRRGVDTTCAKRCGQVDDCADRGIWRFDTFGGALVSIG